MKRPFILFGLAAVFVALRVAWGLVDPLHFDVVKSAIYVRDALCLGPAALFASIGVAQLRPVQREQPVNGKWILGLAVAAFAGCASISNLALLGIPAVADEAAYLWQGEVFASGTLWSSVPSSGEASLIQYVGDLGAHRLGVFFPGSSLPLALGVALGIEGWVNPLLSAGLVLVTAWSARRLFSDSRVAAMSAALLAVSPFLLFQGASYFGQVWTAVLTVPAFTLALSSRRRIDPVLVGALAGVAMFSRPLSAAVLGAAVAAVWIVTRKGEAVRLLSSAMAGAAIPGAVFAWMNWSLTGNVLETVHTALLPEDKPVLGMNIVANVLLNTVGMAVDASGLVLVSVALFAVGLVFGRRNPIVVAIACYSAAHTLAYAFYYNHGISYGPRFLLEITPLVLMVVAAGAARLFAGRLIHLAVVAALLTAAGVVPERARLFHDRAAYLDLAQTEQTVPGRAVVLVTGGRYEFPDPFYEAFVRNGADPGSERVLYLRADAIDTCEAAAAYPDRVVYVLDPHDPSSDDHGATGPELSEVSWCFDSR